MDKRIEFSGELFWDDFTKTWQLCVNVESEAGTLTCSYELDGIINRPDMLVVELFNKALGA